MVFFSNLKRVFLLPSHLSCKLKLPHHCHADSSVHFLVISLLKGIIFRKYLVAYLMAGHLACLCSCERLPAFLPEQEFGLVCSNLYINKANISVGGSTLRWLLGLLHSSLFPRLWCSEITCLYFFSFLIFSCRVIKSSVPTDPSKIG